MKRSDQIRGRGTTAIAGVFVFIVIQIVLTGCATTIDKKGSGVISSREATAIWNSYKIFPNYNYYYSGPKSRPNFLIGIDDKYRLTSKFWIPIDLKSEMLNNWFNWYQPRVGYSQDPYGAFIVGANNERIGLWYSMLDWRLTGAATVGPDNTISVTLPATRSMGGGIRGKGADSF